VTPDVPANVGEVLSRPLRERPDATALVTRTRTLTYRRLDAEAATAANALLALGVRPGDRVAASLPNEAEVVVAFHGAMRIGAIWVGVNRALAAPEKAYLLRDSGSSFYLCDEQAASQVAGQGELPLMILRGDGEEWREALEASSPQPCGIAVDPTAPAGIAYTSGTTGYPKGAVHSQRNLLVPGAATVASRGYGPDLRKGDCLALTILNMMVLTTLLVAQAGGCCIIMDRIDAEGVAEWIRRERVTTFNSPPALIYSLAHHPAVAPEDLASLDDVWSGGADCPERIREAFAAKFGCEVTTTYGLSEAPTLVTIDPIGGPHHAGASGLVMPHLRVRIAEGDGTDVAQGDTGEVCVSGATDGDWAGIYHPMLGYWQREEASAAALRGGELRTGDLGFLDPEGYLVIRDRTSLVVIRGGANVYPAEVERVLFEHPAVVASAVLGLPDERLGERVVAAVELEADAAVTEDQLREHCLASLARYKVPERFVFVEGFDRNSMGKIIRRDLQSLFDA
jgi:acyl-CoA synthetase (AMP-forming)/AMP-acid ligase II